VVSRILPPMTQKNARKIASLRKAESLAWMHFDKSKPGGFLERILMRDRIKSIQSQIEQLSVAQIQ
jgi:hypothetical protein